MAKETSAAVVPIRDDGPDFTKPIDLINWALPVGEYFGNLNNRIASVEGFYNDGKIQGRVDRIQKLPDGTIVIKVMTQWQPGKLDSEMELVPRYVVCIGSCHGVVA